MNRGRKIVVALGRGAFGTIFPDQKKAVKHAAAAIADLVEEGFRVVVTHSNGPQVGMIHTAMTEFHRLDTSYPVAPMSVCAAMSQGYIGYDLQNAIRTELIDRGLFCPVSTVITQVKVDAFDKAFANPTKLIGRLMSAEEAKEEEKKGNYVTNVGEGQYRRLVAAPEPLEIYEIDAIKALTDAGQVVIAAGGGGIPVLEQGSRLKGASAVIEKDLTGGKLAEDLDADVLLFLTGVERVSLNFGSAAQEPLERMTAAQAEEYKAQNQFMPGAMLPKIEAGIRFVKEHPDRKAIVAHLDQALEALKGRTGTVITEA
ncbi:carbamate kinase [Anaerolentibacter hominis]|uniref:carbamate kinase n=1 Tax=Anaerolentibacter hominis TaxID=3079009 RepID=UPI0031B83E27